MLAWNDNVSIKIEAGLEVGYVRVGIAKAQ